MNTTVFICQLSETKQNYIKKKITEYLTNEGYSEEYIDECIDNVMDDRLVNVEEIININELMEV